MKRILTLCFTLVLAQVSLLCQAQQDFSQIKIVPHQLTNSLYYLEGSGGNIGVSIGEDGVFIIDDQFAPLSDKIVEAIASLSDQAIKFVFNTHYHGDHTGGNQNMARAGAVIFAHENVRTQLAAGLNDGDLTQPLSRQQRLGLPVVTYADAIDFHLNGEAIHAFHVGPAHTNGDSFVLFRNANIVHTGDTFRTTGYPVVDGNANGSFLGIIAAYETLLEISDEDTIFLPGHGVLSKQDEVRKQLTMFNTIRNRIQDGIDKGLSLEEVQESKPTAEYDADWEGGRIKGPDLTATVYAELKSR